MIGSQKRSYLSQRHLIKSFDSRSNLILTDSTSNLPVSLYTIPLMKSGGAALLKTGPPPIPAGSSKARLIASSVLSADPDRLPPSWGRKIRNEVVFWQVGKQGKSATKTVTKAENRSKTVSTDMNPLYFALPHCVRGHKPNQKGAAGRFGTRGWNLSGLNSKGLDNPFLGVMARVHSTFWQNCQPALTCWQGTYPTATVWFWSQLRLCDWPDLI